MRIVWGLAVLLAAGTATAQDSLADAALKASAGTLVVMQMPDGSKLWRWAGKVPKVEGGEALLTDLIAPGLARAHWCPNGWDETKRTPATMGLTAIEGRCK